MANSLDGNVSRVSESLVASPQNFYVGNLVVVMMWWLDPNMPTWVGLMCSYGVVFGLFDGYLGRFDVDMMWWLAL